MHQFLDQAAIAIVISCTKGCVYYDTVNQQNKTLIVCYSNKELTLGRNDVTSKRKQMDQARKII